MVTDWEIYQLQDLPARVWDFIKKENFFGLGIPEAYGGMGFSANAMNLICVKLDLDQCLYVLISWCQFPRPI